jgi:hypothetical protein
MLSVIVLRVIMQRHFDQYLHAKCNNGEYLNGE